MRNKPEAPCTVALIVINVAVFFIMSLFGNTEDVMFMLEHGAMFEPLITEEHEYYRIITSMFLHFGIEHLLNNMVILGALGWNLELETGKNPLPDHLSGKRNRRQSAVSLPGSIICRVCSVSRSLRGNLRTDGSASLCGCEKQRKNGAYLRKRSPVYDCIKPLFRDYQQRC